MCLHCQQELSCKSRTVPLLKFAFWVLVSQYWKTVAGPLQGLGMFAETQFLWKRIQLQLRQICIKPWLTKLSSSPTWQTFHLSMGVSHHQHLSSGNDPRASSGRQPLNFTRVWSRIKPMTRERLQPGCLPVGKKDLWMVQLTGSALRVFDLKFCDQNENVDGWMEKPCQSCEKPIPQSNVKNHYERTLPHIQIEVFRTRTKASVFRPHGTAIQGFLLLPLRSKWSPCRILHQDEVGCYSIQVHQDAWSWCPSAVQTSTREWRPCSIRLCHNCPWRLRDHKSWDWRSDKLANTCEK